MVLARPVVVRQDQLAGMPGYTGMTMSAPAAGTKPNN
jgi:hypothetical protein